MRINNNVMALNAHRQLAVNQANSSKSMERLSSGMRINRAGDDAAGLAISEKMRGQIRGLKQASRNAQDGISLIQTAEGALNEIHAILQRMRELAVQSATDTNTDDDRLEIQEEINQLASEIDRIADTTQFNTMELLDGTYKEMYFHIGANEGQRVDLSIDKMDAEALGVNGAGGVGGDLVTEANDGEFGTLTGLKVLKSGEEIVAYDVGGKWYAPDDVELNDDEDELVVKDGAQEVTTTAVKTVDGEIVTEAEVDGEQVLLNADGDVVATYDSDADKWLDADGNEVTVVDGLVLGAAGDGAGINVSDRESANNAIDAIDEAIKIVSGERSKLGAIQNRLEHTIANLGTSAENLQAAESRIRDLDMAEEIMAFTKNNILQQAATAMLAQANMAPQSVLQLLG